MFPLWDTVVAPVIRASNPTRIVEIGALRGETTAVMLESLGNDVELHVIDPVPAFDPSEHEQQFPGRYLFHRDLSLNVLADLPAVDVALVDGDHNWYTVYHELRLLREAARRDDAPLPVLIMHDVLWPYGRRDLYYAPEQIPEEFRQAHDQRGMLPGQSELVTGRGGLSPLMNNALVEGGPRNGVMTAFDDWLAEHDEPVRQVLVPIYFGLLIVVEERRLAQEPLLAEALDELESTEGRQEMLELAERLRLQAVVTGHQASHTNQRRIPQLRDRYLDVLKKSLLNELYAENEARLDHLAAPAQRGSDFDPAKLEDPPRTLPERMRAVELRHESGARNQRSESAPWLPYAPMGRQRLEHLEQCLEATRDANVPGDLVSCGTSRGGDAIFMAGFVEANDMGRRVWVADRFRGPLRIKAEGDTNELRHAGDLNFVRDAFDRYGLFSEQVKFLQGDFAETLPDAPIRRIALLRIEGHNSRSVTEALRHLYDRIEIGGWVIVDDYRLDRIRGPVDEFREHRGITEPLERVDWGGVCWRKTAEPAVERTEPSAAAAEARFPRRPPLVPSTREETIDLSVVVVFHEMKREAERTLHSLSRSYQVDIDDLDYEVIVVENGSSPGQRLGADYVQSFGPEFRYIDLGEQATSSPVPAVNQGITQSRGRNLALMIDGAHVLTPGVLHFGMLGLEAHEPAMVITQQWYVGPGQQPDPALATYDQDYEDELFRKVGWPDDGYRLFRIGHFIGERDWFDGMAESNCLFVPRAVLEQVGGMDESFSVAGGGYANLDLYERIGRQPGLTVVTTLGEGSFHQVHGGTTTNVTDLEERNRRLIAYRDDYVERRGRPFIGHRKPIHYVGAMNQWSNRTRSRRIRSEAFVDPATGEITPGSRPTTPVPTPDELTLDYVERYWHSLDWTNTSWLGSPVEKPPADMIAYQDMVTRVRPAWIVETGTGTGGRALFLASICDLIGHGQVLSIDATPAEDRPTHDRITYLAADPLAEDTIERVAEIVGPAPDALVILGYDSMERLVAAFAGYAELVPDGSYLVIEDTITGGHPVWDGMGQGPNQAVRTIVKDTSDFVADRHMEQFGTTFNPNGFLRRLSGRERTRRETAGRPSDRARGAAASARSSVHSVARRLVARARRAVPR